MSENHKAVCWELTTQHSAVNGLRIVLAGEFVGQQTMTSENQRPRWSFAQYGSVAEAADASVRITQAFESDWTATLIVPPGEVMMHPSEFDVIRAGKAIAPSMRARIYTSLMRRDPRVRGAD